MDTNMQIRNTITRKKVAIDLSYIDHKNKGGQAYFSYNLIKGLYELKSIPDNDLSDFELTIFCSREIKNEAKKYYPNATFCHTFSKIYEIKSLYLFYLVRLLYREFFLPRKIKRGNYDALIFPHDMVSILPHYRKYRTVYIPQDVGILLEKPSKRPLRSKLFDIYGAFSYKCDFKNADIVVAISKDDKKNMVSIFPDLKHKFIQIYDPIDIAPCFIDPLHPVKKEKIIVALNLVYKHKNCITLVKAFEKIMNTIPHKLIIMGRVNEESFQYASSHNLLNRIIFTGTISEELKTHYLKSCELYVSPTTFEGFGMTNVEAILMGANCLLSDLPINREVIGDAASYYAPILDVDSLAKKMKDMLIENTFSLSLENQKEIFNKYSCQNIASQYLSLLNS